MNHRSSRGQTLTLAIFGGLVVLCSIFFILGMVVGRSQVVLSADVAGSDPDDGAEGPETGAARDLTFYESVADTLPPGLAPNPAPRSEEAIPRPALPEGAGEEPASAIFLQVTALRNADQASRLLTDLLDGGFPAFLVRPEPSDDVPLHRVRVGPFASEAEAARARRALEEQGFEPIVP